MSKKSKEQAYSVYGIFKFAETTEGTVILRAGEFQEKKDSYTLLEDERWYTTVGNYAQLPHTDDRLRNGLVGPFQTDEDLDEFLDKFNGTTPNDEIE